MIVFHIDMDAFFAAVEKRDNPWLADKPLIIGADPKKGKGRGVVSTACYIARGFGVHSAMPISLAYKLCPQAVFLPVNIEKYKKVSERIMKILSSYSLLLEPVSIDEAYLGFETTDYSKAKTLAKKIKEEIWQKERLTCSIGVAPNKLMAKIASDEKKPDGLTLVQLEEVENFLATKDVKVIPGVGEKTAQRLIKLKVETIGQLRNLPLEKLKEAFGKRGEEIYFFARGIDRRPIELEREPKSIGKETTFDKDIISSKEAINVALRLLKAVTDEAKEKNFSFSTLVIKVRYFDFETHTAQKKVSFLTFEKLRVSLLQLLLKFLGKKKIRLVGVRVK